MAIIMRYGQTGQRIGTNTETKSLLWSTDSTQTGSFTCSLSQPATNFKRIRIEYTRFSEILDPNTAIEISMNSYSLFTDGSNNPLIALGARGSSYDYARVGYFQNNFNEIRFTNARRLANTDGTSTAYCMPRRIYGIN